MNAYAWIFEWNFMHIDKSRITESSGFMTIFKPNTEKAKYGDKKTISQKL